MSSASEGDLQRSCLSIAKNFPDVYVMRLNVDRRRKDVRGLEPGTPDILMIWKWRYVFVELKAKKGKLTQSQKDWHDRAKKNGMEFRVCDDTRAFLGIIDFLRRT